MQAFNVLLEIVFSLIAGILYYGALFIVPMFIIWGIVELFQFTVRLLF